MRIGFDKLFSRRDGKNEPWRKRPELALVAFLAEVEACEIRYFGVALARRGGLARRASVTEEEKKDDHLSNLAVP